MRKILLFVAFVLGMVSLMVLLADEKQALDSLSLDPDWDEGDY